MANIVEFPSASRSHEDAALWLTRLDKGLGDEGHAALRAWLEKDPSNRAALLDFASLWDELDVLAELSELFPLEQPLAALPRRAMGPWLAGGFAAVALVGAAFVGYTLRVAPSDAPIVAQSRSATFETAVGGYATQQLPDGSVVTLNTDTEVAIAFIDQVRDVHLRRGEAHFDVAHDAARPFRVHVGDRILQAVGTAFSVHLQTDGEIELTVTEGTVKIAAAPQAQALSAPSFDTTVVAGELAILDESTTAGAQPQIIRLLPADLDIKLAWQRGMLIFRGEPLQQMLGEVARYTTTQFILDGDELRDLRVGGYFRAGDIDGLLLTLNESFQIEAERLSADRIVLRTTGAAQ